MKLIKLIISLPNKENSAELLTYADNYLHNCKDVITHIETFMRVVKRRPYLSKYKLSLPQNRNINDVMLSMYTHYCKRQIDSFMSYIHEAITFDITPIVSYCVEHNLYNELLIALCGYISNDCKRYRRLKINTWHLRRFNSKLHTHMQPTEEHQPIEYIDINKYMKPFIANTFLYNIELLPITNNISVHNTDMFIKVNNQDIQHWKLAKQVKDILHLNVNDCDDLVEINYELYLLHPWYDELTINDYKDVNNNIVGIWLLWYIVNYYGTIYTHKHKLYSPWCIYDGVNTHETNIESKRKKIYKVLVNGVFISEVSNYMTKIMNASIDHKNDMLSRLQQLKTDIESK